MNKTARRFSIWNPSSHAAAPRESNVGTLRELRFFSPASRWWFASSRRRITGENKRRFVSLEQDFDLDLVYITSDSLVLSPKKASGNLKGFGKLRVGEVLKITPDVGLLHNMGHCYVQDWESIIDWKDDLHDSFLKSGLISEPFCSVELLTTR